MNIPPKYEDVVAKLDAAMETIALKHRDMVEAQTAVTGWARKYDALQQRLTVAEQRAGELEGLLSNAQSFVEQWDDDSQEWIDLSSDISNAIIKSSGIKP